MKSISMVALNFCLLMPLFGSGIAENRLEVLPNDSGKEYRAYLKDGLRQISRFCNGRYYEDSWLFDGKSLWLDIGIDGTRDHIRTDFRLLDRRKSTFWNGDIVEVHFHRQQGGGVNLSPPSLGDLLYFAVYYDDYKKLFDFKSYKQIVVNRYGYWIVDPKTVRDFLIPNAGLRQLLLEVLYLKRVEDALRGSHSLSTERVRVAQRVVKLFEHFGIKMEYHEFRE